jgi:hypothetical protein
MNVESHAANRGVRFTLKATPLLRSSETTRKGTKRHHREVLAYRSRFIARDNGFACDETLAHRYPLSSGAKNVHSCGRVLMEWHAGVRICGSRYIESHGHGAAETTALREFHRPHVGSRSTSEVESRSRRVRSAPMNGHRQTGPTGPFRAKLGRHGYAPTRSRPPRSHRFRFSRAPVLVLSFVDSEDKPARRSQPSTGCPSQGFGCMPCKKRSGLSGPMGISSKLIMCALPRGSFSSIS